MEQKRSKTAPRFIPRKKESKHADRRTHTQFYNPLKSEKRRYRNNNVEFVPPYRGKDKYCDSASDSDADSDVNVDDEPRARAYRFRLDRASPSPTTPTENESEDEPLVADYRAVAGAGKPRSVLSIAESRYTGMGVPGRRHGARVTVVQGPKAGAPLFRWMWVLFATVHFKWYLTCLDISRGRT